MVETGMVMIGRVGKSMRGINPKIERAHMFIREYKIAHPVPYACHEMSKVSFCFSGPRGEGVLKHGVFASVPGRDDGLVLLIVFPDTPDWLLSHLLVHELSHAYSVPLDDERKSNYLERPSETWPFAVADAWLLHEYGKSYWELWDEWVADIGKEGVAAYRARIESIEVEV